MFSEAFFRNGIVLSSFDKWVPHAITRFILVIQVGGSYPRLQVDVDPLSIQYPTSSSILPTSSIPTISMTPLFTMRQLSHRNVKLVSHDGSSYVLKTIEWQDELNQWRTELKTLLLLRFTSYHQHHHHHRYSQPLLSKCLKGCVWISCRIRHTRVHLRYFQKQAMIHRTWRQTQMDLAYCIGFAGHA